MIRVILSCASLAACSVEPSDDDDTFASVDDDHDDADDDSDDTNDDPPSPIDGTWAGGCDGEVVFTYPGTTYTYTQSLDVVGFLVLLEDPPGIVTGEFPFTLTYAYTSTTTTTTTQGVLILDGTRNGADVRLHFVGYTSTAASPTTYDIPAWFDLVLAGDALDGAIVFRDEYDVEHPVPCTFARES